jgi:hypothetical protein
MSLENSRIVVSSKPMDAVSYLGATGRPRKSRIRPAILIDVRFQGKVACIQQVIFQRL